MKNNKLILILLVAFLFAFQACEKDYDKVTVSETDVPNITVLGDNPVVVIKGTDFTDPGISAERYTNNNQDTVKNLEYTVLGEVNANLPGGYTLTYKVDNSEGIPFYATRGVTVADITGYDTFDLPVGTYAGIRVGRAGGDVTITKVTTGIYSVSDLLGGYYSLNLGFGPDYGAPGVFVIDENGNLRSELGFVKGWAEEVYAINPQFDSNTNVISYTATFESGFSFAVTLTLQ